MFSSKYFKRKVNKYISECACIVKRKTYSRIVWGFFFIILKIISEQNFLIKLYLEGLIWKDIQ